LNGWGICSSASASRTAQNFLCRLARAEKSPINTGSRIQSSALRHRAETPDSLSPPTPEAVEKAIKETPASELQDKLAAAEADAQVKYPYLAEIAKAEAEAQARTLAETQLTMRAELAAGDPLQRWWRPLYGLELTLECAALAVVIIHDLWGGDTTVLAAATQATALLLGYWGLRFAVLGVYVQGRSREKEATITGQLAPSVIDQIVKAVRRR
jgi:hypothetical protein